MGGTGTTAFSGAGKGSQTGSSGMVLWDEGERRIVSKMLSDAQRCISVFTHAHLTRLSLPVATATLNTTLTQQGAELEPVDMKSSEHSLASPFD